MLTERSPQDLDSLLKEQDAAELLSLSVRTLQSWRMRLVGPAFIQVGRAVRYRRRDLLAWISANTCGGPEGRRQ